VAMLRPGDFFGEGALAGQPVRMATAIATSASAILVIEKEKMIRLLHEQHALSDRFLATSCAEHPRRSRSRDQLFNSSEKRLARTLLLLARYGRRERSPSRAAQDLGMEDCSRKMVGTTRSAVNFFHEQVQEARLHRLQRRPQDQRVPAERRAARLTRLPISQRAGHLPTGATAGFAFGPAARWAVGGALPGLSPWPRHSPG